ncbi:hypothetical protein GS575_05280 [Rhodococcus hoagii]|nr:hypothetical protein [Prescottella equi]
MPGTVTESVVSISGSTTVTFCAVAEEFVKPAAAVKFAARLCVPTDVNVCGSVAEPLATGTGDPIGAPLSVNCTEPWAFAGVTVAVRSTDEPVSADAGALSDNEVATSGFDTATVCTVDVESSKPLPAVN